MSTYELRPTVNPTTSQTEITVLVDGVNHGAFDTHLEAERLALEIVAKREEAAAQSPRCAGCGGLTHAPHFCADEGKYVAATAAGAAYLAERYAAGVTAREASFQANARKNYARITVEALPSLGSGIMRYVPSIDGDNLPTYCATEEQARTVGLRALELDEAAPAPPAKPARRRKVATPRKPVTVIAELTNSAREALGIRAWIESTAQDGETQHIGNVQVAGRGPEQVATGWDGVGWLNVQAVINDRCSELVVELSSER